MDFDAGSDVLEFGAWDFGNSDPASKDAHNYPAAPKRLLNLRPDGKKKSNKALSQHQLLELLDKPVNFKDIQLATTHTNAAKAPAGASEPAAQSADTEQAPGQASKDQLGKKRGKKRSPPDEPSHYDDGPHITGSQPFAPVTAPSIPDMAPTGGASVVAPAAATTHASEKHKKQTAHEVPIAAASVPAAPTSLPAASTAAPLTVPNTNGQPPSGPVSVAAPGHAAANKKAGKAAKLPAVVMPDGSTTIASKPHAKTQGTIKPSVIGGADTNGQLAGAINAPEDVTGKNGTSDKAQQKQKQSQHPSKQTRPQTQLAGGGGGGDRAEEGEAGSIGRRAKKAKVQQRSEPDGGSGPSHQEKEGDLPMFHQLVQPVEVQHQDMPQPQKQKPASKGKQRQMASEGAAGGEGIVAVRVGQEVQTEEGGKAAGSDGGEQPGPSVGAPGNKKKNGATQPAHDSHEAVSAGQSGGDGAQRPKDDAAQQLQQHPESQKKKKQRLQEAPKSSKEPQPAPKQRDSEQDAADQAPGAASQQPNGSTVLHNQRPVAAPSLAVALGGRAAAAAAAATATAGPPTTATTSLPGATQKGPPHKAPQTHAAALAALQQKRSAAGLQHPSTAPPPQGGPAATKKPSGSAGGTSFLDKMRARLAGGRFRHLNEELYTRSGDAAFTLMQKQPELFSQYHDGFQRQTRGWPKQPVDVAIGWLRGKKSEIRTVADFGCGDAKIAASVPQTVHSFDLIASAPGVIACNMAEVPLEAGCVDAAVFSLALMGTDYGSYLEEAFRVLKPKGWLWIAEVRSRFAKATGQDEDDSDGEAGSEDDEGGRGGGGGGDEDFGPFLSCLKRLGFRLVSQDASNKMFVVWLLRKGEGGGGKLKSKGGRDIVWPPLKACVYKKR